MDTSTWCRPKPADWSVHPFSGAIEDGYVWGRGAVDMKDMVGMMIVVARQLKRAGVVPPRDLVFAFVADEEHGGKYGSHWLVDNRPDLFDGVTEAIGEVGGFSLTVPRPDGGERRLYLIETAEKGHQWMRLTARGQAGHGSMVHDQNAVTTLAEAVARLGRHQFPLVLTDTVVEFLAALSEETGLPFDPESPDLDGHDREAGPDGPHAQGDTARHREPHDAQGRIQGQRDPGDRRSGGGLPCAAGSAGGIRGRGRRIDRP